MAAGVTIIDNSKKAINGNYKSMEKTILASCIKVQAQAKALAPKDTGRLVGSIGYSTKTKKVGNLSPVNSNDYGIVGSDVEYAIYQEFGTRNMAPQPFMRPAIGVLKTGATAADITGIIRQNMNEYLNTFKGGI